MRGEFRTDRRARPISRALRRRKSAVCIALAAGVATTGLSWAPAAGSGGAVGGPGFQDNFDVFLLRSIDAGQTFGQFRNVSNDLADSTTANVAAADGTVHVAWVTGEPPREIAYRRSGNGGNRFGTVVNVSENDGASAESDLAVSGDRVNVVWADNRFLADMTTPDPRYLRSDEAYARSSPTSRVSFATTKNVSNTQGGHTRDPDVAGEGQLAAVVFEDVKVSGSDGIFFNRSTNEGQTWRARPVLVSGASGRQTEPAVAVSNGRVHAVWEEDEGVLGYARSLDRGASWVAPILLPELPDTADHAAIAAAGDRVHVLACGGDLVYHLGSVDGGVTWSAPSQVSTVEGCSRPTVAARGVNVYAAWDAGPDDFTDIYYRRSVNGGASFGPERNLSRNLGASVEPSLTVDPSNGHVFLAWADTTTRPSADRPAISINDVRVTEPVEGTATARFRVTLDRPSEDEVTVEFSTVDDSAEADADYVLREGILVFRPGQTSKVVEVVVLADEEVEEEEAFQVVLLNPQIGVVVDAVGVGTIVDAAT